MDTSNKSSESLQRRPGQQEGECRNALSHMLSQPSIGPAVVTPQDRLNAYQSRQRLAQILDQAIAIADSVDLNAILSELETGQVQEQVSEGSCPGSSNASQ